MANMGRHKVGFFVTPCGIFLSIWFFQMAYWYFRDYSVVEQTALVVGVALIAFSIGCMLIASMFASFARTVKIKQVLVVPAINNLRTLVLVAFGIYILLFYLLVWRTLDGQSLAFFRDEVLSGQYDPGILFRIYSLYGVFVVFLIVFACVKEVQEKNRTPILLLLMLVAATLMAMSRTLMLIGLTIFAVAHTVRWGIRLRTLILYIACVISLFMFAFIALGRMTNEDTALNLLEVYLMGGIRGLSHFIQYNEPRYSALLSFPRFLYGVFCGQGGCEFPIAPPYYDFVETPVVQNIYTAFYLPLHDFGLLGVIFIFLFVGIFAQYSYTRALSGKAIWIYVYGFMAYAMIMSMFDDQFIRAMPVFLMGLFVFLFIEKFSQVFVSGR